MFKGLCESRRWSRPRYPDGGNARAGRGNRGAGRRPWGRASSVFSGPSSVESSSREWIFCSNQRKNCDSSRRHLQMVFQDPYGSLNPRRTIASMLEEGMKIHRLGTKQEIEERIEEILSGVGLPKDASRRYPHEFSGGQRQRLSIARALLGQSRVHRPR